MWFTKYTSQRFVEGRMTGERWKSNETRFRDCRSSFIDKIGQRRSFGILIWGFIVHRMGR